MINSLSGNITDISGNELTIEVAGVGYQVYLPLRSVSKLAIDQSVSVHVHTHVREDALVLYGFIDKQDKVMFHHLLSVSGIGAKSALNILSQAKANEIATAIRVADVDFFTHIPGLGKKSAQRIIVDLKSKLGTAKELDLSGQDSPQFSQALLGLKSLGFSAQEAKEALAKIANKHELTESELIRQALKNLGK